jgi:hypothetical protein
MDDAGSPIARSGFSLPGMACGDNGRILVARGLWVLGDGFVARLEGRVFAGRRHLLLADLRLVHSGDAG